MRRSMRAAAALALAMSAGTARAAPRGAAEHAAIAEYQGTQTCGRCHAEQVKDFVRSLHYQHQGPAPFLPDAQQGKNAGMMVSY